MSKLQDIINQKLDEKYGKDNYSLRMSEVPVPTPTDIPEKKEDEAPPKPYYDEAWLGKIVLHRRYAVSDDKEKVKKILAALNRRNGYCPCGGTGEQFKCPCKIMRENNICKCGLFQSVKDRNITGSSSAVVKRDE